MKFFKNNEEDLKIINPPNFGWIEKKLNKTEIDYLWKCIDNRKESYKKYLVGNIHESNTLVDKGNWFFYNTLLPLCKVYSEQFKNIGNDCPVNQNHPYCLGQFWVNYQKQNEFNPSHSHNGVYSFVIWMKIPTKHKDQNNNPISLYSNSQKISTFNFQYIDILGKISTYTYEMNPEVENTLLFFPSDLNHCVYPFLNCNEERISISGNILLNTSKVI